MLFLKIDGLDHTAVKCVLGMWTAFAHAREKWSAPFGVPT
jgi:hypothetical protein